jgi:hypothetical protein
MMSAAVIAIRITLGAHLPMPVSLGLQIVVGAGTYLATLKLIAPRSVGNLWTFASIALKRQSEPDAISS